jgi:acyl-CoA synthetase (AMP-forming)/AMP-acid ligase II
VTEQDGAQVIFTTGSTGSPKPALLSHRGIACQNLCLGTAFHFTPEQRVLCNLPASHVGGQAEVLMTTLFMGGTAVTLEVFDAVKSLEAMERLGVTLIGQIPAMFQMEWRTADYGRRNLAGLRTAVYGGQAVPRPFLDEMLKMAPHIATGLGLTETSGFCTYTALTNDAEALARGIGRAMPAYPMSIRQAMTGDGSAGAELSAGEIGHVCFRGPQTFLGYVNDPEATAATLASDGWLYTGDMGRVDEHGLHFSGRAKWVLKPSGYQVFPGDVETHFSSLAGKVANIGVVGHPHRRWSEGIMAFVEKRPGADLTEAELRKHARSLTAYMRPLHYVILEPGAMPLNRTAKVDVVRLQQLAKEEVARLRARGRWD